MNRFNNLAICLSSAAILVRAASAAAKTKEEFCQNLADLEAHIVASSKAWNDSKNHTLSESASGCACVDADDGNGGSFAVDCSLADSYPVQAEPTVYFERMLFHLKGGGEYALGEASWGLDYDSFDQSHEVSVVREEFYFDDDGELAGCKANACKSCDICDDGEGGRSVAIDCSYVDIFGETYGKVVKCDEGYERAYVNTFDFGRITGEGTAVAKETLPAGDDSGERSPEAFCKSLAGLETDMNQSFEKRQGKTFTSTFECSCGELANDGGSAESFTVDCAMEGADGHMTFQSTERMVFELNDQSDKYELIETSWSWNDSFDGGDNERESFALENGAVVSCEASGCNSCKVCEDGKSIEVDCSNIDVGFYSHECGDGYTGSFSHTYDFGVISARAAPPEEETPSNDAVAAPRGMSPVTAAALAFVAALAVWLR